MGIINLNDISIHRCPVCGTLLTFDYRLNHWFCSECGYSTIFNYTIIWNPESTVGVYLTGQMSWVWYENFIWK